LEYILNNYDKTSFDLWEENEGWHFYTRMVQIKFLKECLFNKDLLDIDELKVSNAYKILIENTKDHINGNSIISSFDKSGTIIKYEDAANILAFCHIDFDQDILERFPLDLCEHTCDNLIDFFRKKYNNDEINLIGRYKDDKYYDGHAWILCSLAMAQYFVEFYKSKNITKGKSPFHRSKSNPNNTYIEIANQILEKILTLDTNLILPEQFNPITNEFISAKKLTWNYSELYKLIKILS